MDTRKTPQQDMFTKLWNRCDFLRGNISPIYYQNIILTILFLKYISDVHAANLSENVRKYGNNPERIQRAMQLARFIVPEESSFNYLYKRRRENSIGELTNRALTRLEKENPEKLVGEDGKGIFENTDFTGAELGDAKKRNELLRNLLEAIATINLYPENKEHKNIAGEIFMFFVESFALETGKDFGNFTTPKDTSSLLAKLIKSNPGARICDPASGSGGLLIEAALEIGNSNFSLYGQEIYYNVWAIAKMNMIMHGFDSTVVRLGDTLHTPKLVMDDKLMQFDTVISHPPFSLSNWGAEEAQKDKYNRFFREIPPNSKGDWAFISHMLAVANNDNGKVGVIVPHGVLFRGGGEGRIRRHVIEEKYLEAVIGLPTNLFYGTTIPAAIILFNKAKESGETLFIDASQECEKIKKQNRLREKDIQHIVDTYTHFTNGRLSSGIVEERYSYVATLEKIRKNDYNLNIPNYVNMLEENEKDNFHNINKQILELKIKLVDIQSQLASSFKELNSL